MKIRSLIVILLAALMIFFMIKSIVHQNKKEMNILLLPSLPRPIANEYALITSAGQSTESYIINNIANQLMIHNYFMPQATEEDLEGINTLVFVVGYSPIGKRLHGISYEDEKERIAKLLNKSKKYNLVIITVYIGGKERRNDKTDELLKLICPQTDYLIGTKEADYDNFLSEQAKKERIPLTLVNRISDIPESFASAFR